MKTYVFSHKNSSLVCTISAESENDARSQIKDILKPVHAEQMRMEEVHSMYQGWECPDSPTGYCDYEQEDGTYDEDSCRYCGEPEERK